MKTLQIARKLFLLSFALSATTLLWSQQKASPPDSVMGVVNGANIRINYSSPSVKGRAIWDSLVPYHKVWRAGANSATTFQTDKDIMVEGQKLPAGKYSLYALVEPDEWTMIFNSQTGQWGIKRTGETTEDPVNDVIRVKVKPQKSLAFNERLRYVIDGNGFSLNWENLSVPVAVK